MDQLTSQIALGLVSGALLVLLALGLNLIFGLLEFINFSHGALYMLGAYAAVNVVDVFGAFWWALVFVPIIMGVAGVILERTLIRPMYARNQVDALLLTFGLSYVLIESVRIAAGSGGQLVRAPSELAFQVSVGVGRPIPAYLLFVVALVALVVLGLWLFLNRTDVGLIVRAGIRDATMVRALGVRFDRYRVVVFAVGVAIAGVAGVLTAPITGVYPEMGADILILAFVVVVVGGMGSFWGSVLSGLLIGVVVSLTTLYASVYAGIVPFLLMILVMTFRPRGLLGDDVTAERLAEVSVTDDAPGPMPLTQRRDLALGPWRQLVLLLVLVVVVFYTVPDPSLAISMLIYGLWAVSVNLLVGYGGLISFGHALPFGFGSYAAGLVLREVTPNTWLALGAATIGMGLLSLFVGALCLRRTEVYFSMLTLAFAQLGFFIALQWRSVTGGDDGLAAIPSSTLTLPGMSIRMSSIGDPRTFFIVTAVIVVVVFALLILYTDSPLGRVLTAIRESEERARGCGYNTRVVQLITFAVAGAVAGLAGGLNAMLNSFVGLSPYWLLSGVVLIMAILGGRGSLFGPFLGAVAFLSLEHYLSQRFASWQLIVGTIFVLCVLAFPQGLWGVVAGTGDRRGLLDLVRWRR